MTDFKIEIMILNEKNLTLKDVFLYTVSDGGKETVILTSGENVSARLKKGKNK